MLKILSLFSGIGAPEQALQNLGIKFKLVGFSEVNEPAIKSYCKIHNVLSNQNLGDITKININKLPLNIDLIVHGSPCQDYSSSGKGKGGDKGSGTRSSLMWNSVDIIEHCKPKYVLWENVKNLLSAKHRHNFDAYLEIMDKLGYDNYYKVLNAKDYGIPQNRERIFTISIRKDLDIAYFQFPQAIDPHLSLSDILEKKPSNTYSLKEKHLKNFINNNIGKIINIPCIVASRGRNPKNPSDRTPGVHTEQRLEVNKKGLSNTLTSVLKDNYVLTYKNNDICENEHILNLTDLNTLVIRKLTPREYWRLMGFSDEQFNKAAEVCAATELYKQAANSIVVNVLEEIFKQLFL